MLTEISISSADLLADAARFGRADGGRPGQSVSYGADVANLLTTFGGDAVTETMGQAALTNRNSGTWRFVGYGIKQGNPPAICAILVYWGTLTYTGPDATFAFVFIL